MRRLILVVLLISALLFGACAPASAPPTPLPAASPVKYVLTTSVEPSDAGYVDPSGGTYDADTEVTIHAKATGSYTFDYWNDDTSDTLNPTRIILDSDKHVVANFKEYTAVLIPENLGTIPQQLRGLEEEMGNLIAKYPIIKDEDFLVHEFSFGRGGSWGMFSRVPAVNVSEADAHIHNAYYLADKSRLPSEVKPRHVTRDEIALEINQAISLLEQQVFYSYSWEESDIKWAKESTEPEINRESTFEDIVEFYDKYREDLSRIITFTETTLSILVIEPAPAEFKLTNLRAVPFPETENVYYIDVDVENIGGSKGIYQPICKIDGEKIELFKAEAVQKIELNPGEKKTVRLEEASTELLLLALLFNKGDPEQEECDVPFFIDENGCLAAQFVVSVDSLSVTVTFTKPQEE